MIPSLLLRRLAIASSILVVIAALPGLAHQPYLFISGYLITYAIDRYIHPLCPSCANDHNHEECATRLHGLGWPMIVAFSLHALADGFALSWGVVLHKVPECAAMYVLFRSAFPTSARAVAATFAIQALTPLAFFLPAMPAALEPLSQGSLLFLGLHALHPLRAVSWSVTASRRRSRPSDSPDSRSRLCAAD